MPKNVSLYGRHIEADVDLWPYIDSGLISVCVQNKVVTLDKLQQVGGV